jgi:hypothetical protein
VSVTCHPSRASTVRGVAYPPAQGLAKTKRGALRFLDQLAGRVEPAWASGGKLLRADSGSGTPRSSPVPSGAGLTLLGRKCARANRADSTTVLTLLLEDPARARHGSQNPVSMRPLRRSSGVNPRPRGELVPSWQHYPIVINRRERLEKKVGSPLASARHG